MSRPEQTGPGGEAPKGPGPRAAGPSLRPIESQELFGDRGVVQILHEGELYTLRITRNNRLILTK
ncbi:hemin uptake protein HemP [Myxococcota bacterium]|nr:hemin uptake protein HemP [Myxococcota bacterium]